MSKASFGIVGLGVMGSNLALNVLDRGHSLSVYNRDGETESHLLPEFLSSVSDSHQVQGFSDLSAFVVSLNRPRQVLLMIKAGTAVDTLIDLLIPHLDEGDIIIDGGNSLYKDTVRRESHCRSHGLHFVGMGVSGGAEGARKGPSIMVGGSKESYSQIGAVIESIAAKDDRNGRCCAHVGEGGAGHFVKMIHNGIEYAEMQLLAESYDLLRHEYSYAEIASIFQEWQEDDLGSFLLECTIDILQHRTDEHFTLDLILDKAANKGTGGWSGKAALDLGVGASMMVAAVFARYQSSYKQSRVTLSAQVNQYRSNVPLDISQLKDAYRAARIINHHQGFEVIKAASDTYDWKINFSELSRIWTNGCILRSKLMAEFVDLFKAHSSVFDSSAMVKRVDAAVPALNYIIKLGAENRVPLLCYQAAQSSWFSSTSERLPANMIQAQRDYFGAHTYRRVDHPESVSFHTDWKGS